MRDKTQCPMCLQWFVYIERHKMPCKGIKPRKRTLAERYRGRNDANRGNVFADPQGYGDALSTGFAMLSENFED